MVLSHLLRTVSLCSHHHRQLQLLGRLRGIHSTLSVFGVKGTQIKMPALSPTMTEGTIVAWLKQEGDTVQPGDAICEVQTDKAVVAVEADDEAILAKIVLPENSKDVKIGQLIALMVEPGEDWKDVEIPAGGAAAPPPSATAAPPKAATAQAATSTATTTSEVSGLMGPAVRNLIHLYQLNASAIPSSGPHGSLLKGDVLQYVTENKLEPKASQASPPPFTATQASRAPTAAPGAKYVDIELSNMRRTIAKRLTASKQSIPHAYMGVRVNLNAILAERKRLAAQEATKVSLNDFIIKACGIALRKVPALAVNWNESAGRAEPTETIDISIAVATPSGLITPIIRRANTLCVGEISAEVRVLAGKAKEGKLKPAEFQGGTFSISNLGMFGVRDFIAVINPPQCAIMAVGTTQQVMSPDVEGQVNNLMTATLSYDARAVSEDEVALFLETFRSVIQDPKELAGTGATSSRRLASLLQ